MDPEVPVITLSPTRAREPGAQPIPGYRLIEPLGRGGFGEVWKCEAPGGLFKAIKFVSNLDGQSSPAAQEREALQRVKAIRHPFILSLDRVEVVDGVLVIVMELADKSLHGLLGDCQAQNLPGIPREELLGYLLEAAEALDWMNFGHGLQHLDIKPHNLFLVSNHLKVADFGLVDNLSDGDSQAPQRRGGVTPLYASPELLGGKVSRHCDQYSLAIAYQQLLTGTVPFWCSNMYQLMLQHLNAQPNLTPLPAADRPVLARALAKSPGDRFPSCLDFLQALVCGGDKEAKVDRPRRPSAVRKIVQALRAEEKPACPMPRPPSASAPPVNTSVRVDTPRGGSVLETVPRPGLAAIRPNAVPSPRPSSVSTPAYVSPPASPFLRCTGQYPLGDVWAVEDDQGRPRRALCPHTVAEHDPVLIDRLRGLTHKALPPTEVAWSPAGQLVLVTDEFEQTLRDRLESCRQEGLPGIPRGELLDYLRASAHALDALYQQHNLPHLGLNPSTIVLQQGTLWLADFGLVPLVWLPRGQTAGLLNGRYAAPELFEKSGLAEVAPGETMRAAPAEQAGPAADQYSLALIYAEMLSGVPPRAGRQSSPQHRRVGDKAHRKTDSRVGLARVDLDVLPASDRDVLSRALHHDPRERFTNCTAFVEFLEAAAPRIGRVQKLYHRLPAVIPFASLQGEPPPKDVVLPAVNQVAISLATPVLSSPIRPRTIVGPRNARYVQHSNDLWECKCPVQVFTGAVPIMVEGFRDEWQARIVEEKENSFALHIDLQPAKRPGDRAKAPPVRLTFELEVRMVSGSAKHYAEAHMRVRSGVSGDERIGRLLPALAPRLFDSMRDYLQAAPEQRSEERWQCPQPLHVYPVLPDLELDEVLDGISRNISLGGVSFRVAKAPQAEQAYLHWHKSDTVSSFAILARIIRVQPMIGGGYEIGAVFPRPDPRQP